MAFRKHTKIFTVFSFLRLRSPDLFWYQWVYPSIVFLILVGAYHLLNERILQIDLIQLVADLNGLIGVLIGFYIAALAAVSSFSNENLDQIMKGRAPSLVSFRGGKRSEERLTRRRFLAILFGYSAATSIALFGLGILQGRVASIITEPQWVSSLMWIGTHLYWTLYTWLASSLLVVTLLGLHYLVERMHRE